MGAKLGTNETIADLNLTPLIDIVLVVLIIMMVNIPIQIEQMGVKLPGKVEVNTPPPDTDVKQLVIAVYPEKNGDFALALNRTLMSEHTLRMEVTTRLRNMEKKRVFVDADESVPFGRVVDMLDLARAAGADAVGLAKMKDGGPAPYTATSVGSTPRGIIVGNVKVVFYEGSTVATLSAKTADATIRAHMTELMGCYQLGLAQSSTLTGQVVARVDVGPDGQLMGHSISSDTLGNDAVTTCIDEQVLPTLAFEPLGDQNTAAVQFPLVFSPG